MSEKKKETVENYKFEPIKGYPMLNWRGKRPFHSTQFFPAQLKEIHGTYEENGWINKIFWGDNLQVMSHLLKDYRNSVKLIYIDPPFDSKATYKKTVKIKKDSVLSDQNSFEEMQYSDLWNNDEYLQFMYERLILMKELLDSDGVIALHCDWHKSHHLRCLLDEVFGSDHFVNELIWHYYNKMQGNVNHFAANHDVVLVYAKGSKFTFNKIRQKRDEPVKQIKRVWDKATQSLVNAKDENGKVIYINSTHKTIDDVWSMPMLQPADKLEPLDYPTKKPEALIERIIVSYSNPNDIVFDCFMGAGTTQAVAAKYGRKFIGTDINYGSIQMTTKRLIRVMKEVSSRNYIPTIKNGLYDSSEFLTDEENVDYRKYITSYPKGFAVYNVNNYDIFKNESEAKELIIQSLEITPIHNSIFNGEKDGRMVKIMPVNRIATRADLNELINGFDYKTFKKRKEAAPNKPTEKILLVCMGHEIDLKASLEYAVKEAGFDIDVEVVDILRDKTELQFKRDPEAKVSIKKGKLIIDKFYPMNLLQKLSLQKSKIEDWRELVESVMIDWNYDGAVLSPSLIDIPERDQLVSGEYEVPKDAGTIRVKITDLLSESLETEVSNG